MAPKEIRHATQSPKKPTACDKWLDLRAEVEEIQLYWPFCKDIVVIDGIVMKGRGTVVPASFQ